MGVSPRAGQAAGTRRLGTAGLTFAEIALALDMPWGRLTGQAVVERMVATVALVLSGLGAPLIVMGEMLRVFLDQRRLLADIKGRLESQPGPGGR